MLAREILLHLIGYNLIRGLMAETAAIHDQDVARISFKASVQAVHHFAQVIARTSRRRQALQLTNDLLENPGSGPGCRIVRAAPSHASKSAGTSATP